MNSPSGFFDDPSTQAFCAMMILSAIDEARQISGQIGGGAMQTRDAQLQARYFLTARRNRSLVETLLDGMGAKPEWFFSRVVKKLILQHWPEPRQETHDKFFGGVSSLDRYFETESGFAGDAEAWRSHSPTRLFERFQMCSKPPMPHLKTIRSRKKKPTELTR